MKKYTIFSILIILSASLTSFAATLDWWEDANLYQIYPRSFKDSDGDGLGDLKGITQNLDYLKEIGITATWLSPIFKSPMVDNGYDISNFTDIDPTFGTLEDFDDLLKKAKEIGLKVILDFVPNHSSDECEWFQKSINREDGYDDFYVWADGVDDPENPGKKLPPNNWVSEFGGSMWTWIEKRQQFYLHQFLPQQPDFDFRNEKVHKVMLDVLKFWLDRGVDGFRVDALTYVYEKINKDGSYPDQDPSEYVNTREQPESIELIYEWRDYVESYRKQNGGDTVLLLAEAYSPIEYLDKMCGNGTNNGAHLPFNFNLIDLDKTSNAKDLQNLIDDWMNVMWKNHKMANWVSGNHDKDRVSLKIGLNKTDLMSITKALLPGVDVTYYGEEIDMSNVVTCQNCSVSEARDAARTPMQWNSGLSAGFSTANHTWLPISEHYKQVNVENEKAASRSALKLFTDLVNLRNTPAFKAFKEPNGFSYGAVNDNVFEIVRKSENEEYLALVNLGDSEEEIGKLVCVGDDMDSILMEYVIVSQNSPNSIGDTVEMCNIKLDPLEGIVLKKRN